MTHKIDADDARARVWDVIIIGAGLGGGLVGRRLAEAVWHQFAEGVFGGLLDAASAEWE